MKIISKNKKAFFQYTVIEKFQGGIVLYGREIKAIREGKVNINEGFLRFFSNELYIIGIHIGSYSNVGYSIHEPDRKRKILLHKKEIIKISKQVTIRGMTLIPINLFFEKNLVKIEFGIAKGKKIYDKRQSKMEKDIKKKIQLASKKRNY